MAVEDGTKLRNWLTDMGITNLDMVMKVVITIKPDDIVRCDVTRCVSESALCALFPGEIPITEKDQHGQALAR